MERARAWIEAARGRALQSLVALPGGAGQRRYYRARLADGSTAVLMHALPEDPAILPPALRAEAKAIPFLEVTEYLARHGLPVPEIYAVDRGERWVLLEDLGDAHLLDLEPAQRSLRLREAIDLLARVHALPREDALPFRRVFDAEWVRFELRTFAEHGLAERWRAPLAPELDALARAVAALPRALSLRDYQSQNLMVDSQGRLRVLDYQDALCAPPELDLAALVHDSYVELGEPERAELVTRYWRARARHGDPAAFALLVVQRKCKDYGRYRVLVERKGDLRYRPYIARAAASVLGALPALPPAQRKLAEILREALA
jgi:aminoglycoside/choline kinase family phosphotransferase